MVELIRFAAAMARGDRALAARALDAARRARSSRRDGEETALMLVLHAGYPAALEALKLLDERWPGRAIARHEGSRSDWTRRGERLCRRVYGRTYPRLIENVRRLHPTMAVWMVEQGYGRVLSRAGLNARARERIAVAVLAAGAWERQLVSHLLGAARLGCTPAEIRTALEIGARSGGAGAQAAAARAWAIAFSRSVDRPRDRS